MNTNNENINGNNSVIAQASDYKGSVVYNEYGFPYLRTIRDSEVTHSHGTKVRAMRNSSMIDLLMYLAYESTVHLYPESERQEIADVCCALKGLIEALGPDMLVKNCPYDDVDDEALEKIADYIDVRQHKDIAFSISLDADITDDDNGSAE